MTTDLLLQRMTTTACGLWELFLDTGGKPGQLTAHSFWDKRHALVDLQLRRNARAAFTLKQETAKPEDARRLSALAMWADHGMPRIELAHQLAAALMVSTVAKETMELVRKPWPAFVIDVPPGLLTMLDVDNEDSPISRIMVTSAHDKWGFIAYTDDNFLGVVNMAGLGVHQLIGDDVYPDTPVRNQRVFALIGRLIISVCLALTVPDMTTQAGKGHKLWSKAKGDPRKIGPHCRLFKLGKPIHVDFSPRIAEYISGTRTGKQLEARQEIHGHWRRQHYGHGNQLVKVIFVDPYVRGPQDVPMLVQPHVVYAEER